MKPLPKQRKPIFKPLTQPSFQLNQPPFSLHPWTEDEIDRLRLDFLRGLPIKAIARSIERTPTAVNKALTRFQIRTPRNLRKDEAKDSSRRKQFFEKDNRIRETIPWIPFLTVIDWLRNQGLIIKRIEDNYHIGRRPYSPTQLLMFANKLRIEQGHEIFLVEDITC